MKSPTLDVGLEKKQTASGALQDDKNVRSSLLVRIEGFEPSVFPFRQTGRFPKLSYMRPTNVLTPNISHNRPSSQFTGISCESHQIFLVGL